MRGKSDGALRYMIWYVWRLFSVRVDDITECDLMCLPQDTQGSQVF